MIAIDCAGKSILVPEPVAAELTALRRLEREVRCIRDVELRGSPLTSDQRNLIFKLALIMIDRARSEP